jgi:tetratricopeptide (TPR) repeat protein
MSHPAAQAYALRRLSDAVGALGRPADARAHALDALRLCTEAGDRYGQAAVELDLAMLAERRGDLREALDHAQRALTMTRPVGHGRQLAHALNTVGWFHTLLDDPAAGLEYGREAVALNLKLGDTESAGFALDSIANAHLRLGQHAQAAEACERAVAIFRELGDASMTAETLVRLGDIHEAAGRPGAAHTEWNRALRLYTEIDQHQEAEDVRARLRRQLR